MSDIREASVKFRILLNLSLCRELTAEGKRLVAVSDANLVLMFPPMNKNRCDHQLCVLHSAHCDRCVADLGECSNVQDNLYRLHSVLLLQCVEQVTLDGKSLLKHRFVASHLAGFEWIT